MAQEWSAEQVASVVEGGQDAELVDALRAVDARFEDSPDFEASLARFLRSRPDLVDAWASWSAAQRWTPSAYVEGVEAGWYDDGHRHVIAHADEAAAAADFIHRMSVWLAFRRVVEPRGPERDR